MYKSLKFLILLILCSLPAVLQAQKKEARIQYRADVVEVDKNIGKGAQRLLNNVEFIHAGAKMYCDSAYFYSKQNTFDAYQNIFINQGDTVLLYGDFLHYDGNTKKATITGREVKLINKKTTLLTDKLEYELNTGVAYYKQNGHTVSEENTLESIEGYYYTRKKTFVFYDSVVIVNPDYTLYSDTVEYNTETGVARFQGPTNIIGDSSHVYAEKGWYDSKLKLTELKKNAWARNKKQTIYGDYIYYNQISGEGTAKQNVKIVEEEKSILLLGNNARYNENTGYAFITDRAEFVQFTSEGDSLFLHADTLISYPDSSDNRIVFAYYKVKFYRENVQGKCDSLVYTFYDSTIRMYYLPVLWTGKNQVSADRIDIVTRNQKIDKMYLYQSSFITSQEDSLYFNQIKGKNMVCHFNDNQLDLIDVIGNGQTVYFPKDEDEIVGVNLSECSNIKIMLTEGEVSRINFYVSPTGGMYPLEQAPENKLRLKGFNWLSDQRPQSRSDIFKTSMDN